MNYKEIIKKRLDILSPELRAFILDENWRKDAEKVGKQFNLNDDKYASFENEVFLVLLCFEPKKDFAENIKNEVGLDFNMAGWIAEDVNKNIFGKVSSEIESGWQATSAQSAEDIMGPNDPLESKKEEATLQNKSEPVNNIENSVGENFEQIILNQTRAMQPAVASSELGSGVAKPAEAPENLPIEEPLVPPSPKVEIETPDYSSGDPYRESTE